MNSNDLFTRTENGYNCAEVNMYIESLKAEYKKVFEYAKNNEENNAKLKKICRALSDENKALKENTAQTDGCECADMAKVVALIDELAKENEVLKAKLSK